MEITTIVQLVVEIFYVITIIGLVFVIIMENRNPQKSVTWVLILLFLPVIGLVFYLFFGEDHRRLRRMTQNMNKGLQGLLPPDPLSVENHMEDVETGYRELPQFMTRINNAPVLSHNKIDMFTTGTDFFDSLFHDIRNAKHHIHLLYYKIIDDKIGHRLKDLLIHKAQEGVEVRVIYDDVGCIRTKKRFFDAMRKGGVQVATFLPISPLRIASRVNYRNHRKLAVIDGRIGHVGGMNVADCYIEGVKWGVWRDTQMRIEGEGAHGLQTTFINDWYYSFKERLLPEAYYPQVEKCGDSPVQIISAGPTDVYESITTSLFEAINNAREYIYIQTPYFSPPDHILKALQAASIKGVDVRITIPYKSDNAFVDAATFSYVRDLIDANITVYRYRAGFIHSKMYVIDDYISNVGSANIDIRSFDLNFETNAFVYDAAVAVRLKNIFMVDLTDSEEVIPDEWNNRPMYRRVFDSIMRLMSPLF